MNIPLDEVVYFDVITSSSTGAATDADSTPSFEIFEEATDSAIVSGSFTKRTSKTGDYRCTFTASAANGFEVGKWYNVVASATVSAVAGKAVVQKFRLIPAAPIGELPNNGTALISVAQIKAECNINGEGALHLENSNANGTGLYAEGNAAGIAAYADVTGGVGIYAHATDTGILVIADNGISVSANAGAALALSGSTYGLDAAGGSGDIHAPVSQIGGVIKVVDGSGNPVAPASATTSIAAALTALNTITELVAVPGASPSLPQAIALLYMEIRNKLNVTNSAKTVHNNAGTALGSKALSDDGTTYSEAKLT